MGVTNTSGLSCCIDFCRELSEEIGVVGKAGTGPVGADDSSMNIAFLKFPSLQWVCRAKDPHLAVPVAGN